LYSNWSGELADKIWPPQRGGRYDPRRTMLLTGDAIQKIARFEIFCHDML